MIKAAIISALALSGVANAQDSYQRNCECASGITGRVIDGAVQCWICSPASEPVIRGRVQELKGVVESLGGCTGPKSAGYTRSQLILRAGAYHDLAEARDEENACWAPPDPAHIAEANENRVSAGVCASRAGL